MKKLLTAAVLLTLATNILASSGSIDQTMASAIYPAQPSNTTTEQTTGSVVTSNVITDEDIEDTKLNKSVSNYIDKMSRGQVQLFSAYAHYNMQKYMKEHGYDNPNTFKLTSTNNNVYFVQTNNSGRYDGATKESCTEYNLLGMYKLNGPNKALQAFAVIDRSAPIYSKVPVEDTKQAMKYIVGKAGLSIMDMYNIGKSLTKSHNDNIDMLYGKMEDKLDALFGNITQLDVPQKILIVYGHEENGDEYYNALLVGEHEQAENWVNDYESGLLEISNTINLDIQ